jgi:restriction system protein
MGIPDYQSLILPVLEQGRVEISMRDACERIADDLGLTAEERMELRSAGDRTLLMDRAQWAKTYLKKAGLVRYTGRGKYEATPEGLDLLQKGRSYLRKADLRVYDGFAAFERPHRGGEASDRTSDQDMLELSDDATPDETIRDAHALMTEALSSDLLDRVRAASPVFFERLVVNLLLAMGYGGTTASVEHSLTPTTGDGGIDGVIDQDPLGLDRVYVQAKRYAEDVPVGVEQVRAFAGSLHGRGASKGVFFTTSRFTAGARDEAERMNVRIVLIDGAGLARAMIRHDVGCRAVETVTLKRLDEDFFDA